MPVARHACATREQLAVLVEVQVAELRLADALTAFSSMLSNTGSSRPASWMMTFSTSDVAVCCSSASVRSSVRWRSSLSSRVFSMAITACAAKFVTSSICLSVNGRTS